MEAKNSKECDELLEKVFEKRNFSQEKVSIEDVQAVKSERFSNISLIEEVILHMQTYF